MKKINYLLIFIISISFFTSCIVQKKGKFSKKEKLLASVVWIHRPNVIGNNTNNPDEKVKEYDIVETILFEKDAKDPSKFAYSKRIGEGFLTVEVLGYWNFNKRETELILIEWDYEKGETKAPVTYKIIELTKEKLILENKSTGKIKDYVLN